MCMLILLNIDLNHSQGTKQLLFAATISLQFSIVLFQAVHSDLDSLPYAAVFLTLLLFMHTLGG